MGLEFEPGAQRMEVDQEEVGEYRGRGMAMLKEREKIREWTSTLLNPI